MTTTTQQIQIRIIRRHGKDKAQYRSRYASGAWQERWFHMTMADARKAIRDGVAHVGVCENCEVISV